jgi:Mg2+-importing ATPase
VAFAVDDHFHGIPYLPYIGVFGFVPLPIPLLFTVTAITLLYVAAAEITKKLYRRAAGLGSSGATATS